MVPEDEAVFGLPRDGSWIATSIRASAMLRAAFLSSGDQGHPWEHVRRGINEHRAGGPHRSSSHAVRTDG